MQYALVVFQQKGSAVLNSSSPPNATNHAASFIWLSYKSRFLTRRSILLCYSYVSLGSHDNIDDVCVSSRFKNGSSLWAFDTMAILFASLVLSYVVWASFAQANTFLANSSTAPLPPSEDPYYTTPPRYEDAALGAVLRVRSAPGLANVVASCSAAFNILYRTTDSNYKPAWAVITLDFPQPTSSNSCIV